MSEDTDSAIGFAATKIAAAIREVADEQALTSDHDSLESVLLTLFLAGDGEDGVNVVEALQSIAKAINKLATVVASLRPER